MSDEAAGRFGPGIGAWIDGIGSVRDAVRQELVSRHLLAYLPRPAARLRVIDGGCGQGTQAIALARLGHEVVGIDTSEEMLAEARESARAQPEAVRARLRFEPGDVLALNDSTQGATTSSAVTAWRCTSRRSQSS